MSASGKILTGTMVGAGMIGIYILFKKLNQAQTQLVIVPKASLQKLSLDGLTIRLDLLMKNPAKGDFTIKFPFVKLMYKDAMIGSSQVVNTDITIPSYGQKTVEKIMIDIPLENVFSVTTSLLKALQSKQPVTMQAKISTTVIMGLVTIPFNENYNLPIVQGK